MSEFDIKEHKEYQTIIKLFQLEIIIVLIAHIVKIINNRLIKYQMIFF